MKSGLLLLVVVFLMQGCAFDPPETVKPVIGRLALHQMMGVVSLNYHDSEDGLSSYGVLEGCRFVALDTMSKQLYVEEELFKDNSSYYLFELKDCNNPDVKLAFTKKELKEDKFKKLVQDCKNCVEYYSVEKDPVLK